MKSYVNDPKLQHGFAYTPDFKKHMEMISGRDLTGFFADWFYGKGFPTYTVNVEPIQDQMLQEQSISVTIHQGQSDASVSFFEMPVPIKFYGEGKDTTIVFSHTFSGETFLLNPGFAIDSLKFDPDLWLVSSNNTITLDIDDLQAGKELKLVPNPAGDFLFVQHNLGKIRSLQILNMEGKLESIKLKKEIETTIEVNTQNLKPGMYLLRIDYAVGIVTRKFIIKR